MATNDCQFNDVDILLRDVLTREAEQVARPAWSWLRLRKRIKAKRPPVQLEVTDRVLVDLGLHRAWPMLNHWFAPEFTVPLRLRLAC